MLSHLMCIYCGTCTCNNPSSVVFLMCSCASITTLSTCVGSSVRTKVIHHACVCDLLQPRQKFYPWPSGPLRARGWLLQKESNWSCIHIASWRNVTLRFKHPRWCRGANTSERHATCPLTLILSGVSSRKRSSHRPYGAGQKILNKDCFL